MAQNLQTQRVPMEHDQSGDVPQRERLRTDQVKNSAGGFVWRVDDFKRFHRFMVLGSELPTYYIGDKQLGKENAQAVGRLLAAGRGVEVVEEIVKFSVEGRTAKQQPVIFCLAMCARSGNLETKQKAYEVLSQVCRIPTHLFMFVDYCKKLSAPTTGWGRAQRNAIKKWYTTKPPMKLAMDVTKYQKREGWSHADVARLTHMKPEVEGIRCVLKYVVKGYEEMLVAYGESEDSTEEMKTLLHFLKAVEEMKGLTLENEDRVVELILRQQLVREHIPTVCLSSKKVWDALLKKMPMTAMIRNLSKMTSIELLGQNTDQADLVCSKLRDEDALKKARIHPFSVLVALKQYQAGHGDKGKLKWSPNADIATALEEAFYLSFKNVEPTGKRYLLALDVSGSMQSGGCNGAPSVTPAVASGAMAMVTARTENSHDFVGFSDNLVPLQINDEMRLEQVLRTMAEVPMGATDCALPMLYAMEHNLMIDVFVVYTDCETWCGEVHPSEALRRYRAASQIDAKLIVVAMTSNGFTIADPEDPGMFDMTGFDSAAPQVMKEFIDGTI